MEKDREYYRLLADHSTDMISKHDPAGVFLYVSPACQQIVGYTPEELVGRDAYEFFHPEDIENISKSHAIVKETPLIYTVAYRFKHKGGHYVWVEATSKTIRDPGTGHIKEIIATTRDISRRKKAEAEKEQLIIELQDALKRVKTLNGLLPICSVCKKIRDDKGYWNQIETYIQEHSEAEFSHGLCRECAKKIYPDVDLDDD